MHSSVPGPTQAQDPSLAPVFDFVQPLRAERVQGGETATERLHRILPWTTVATNRFSQGVYRVPASEAKRMREIALDPRGWVTALKFDIDGEDASTRWIDAGLPEPNFIVTNPKNGHAHLVYLLKAWVKVDPAKKATRWLAAIERAMTAALQSDVRYAGRLCHNPLNSEAWNVKVARNEPFELAELHAHVDMHTPSRHWTTPADSGIGRNVDVFDRTRKWAYGAAADGFTGSFADWERDVADRVARYNSFPDHPKGDLPASEVRSITKSVATWVWERYANRKPDPEAVARRQEYERQRQARRESARHRSMQSREQYVARAAERRSRAVKWRAEGIPVREIAERLSCSAREVYRLLAATAGTIAQSMASVRKNASTRINNVANAVSAGVKKTVEQVMPRDANLTAGRVVHGSPGPSGSWGSRGERGWLGASATGIAYVMQRCRERAAGASSDLPDIRAQEPRLPDSGLLAYAARAFGFDARSDVKAQRLPGVGS